MILFLKEEEEERENRWADLVKSIGLLILPTHFKLHTSYSAATVYILHIHDYMHDLVWVPNFFFFAKIEFRTPPEIPKVIIRVQGQQDQA